MPVSKSRPAAHQGFLVGLCISVWWPAIVLGQGTMAGWISPSFALDARSHLFHLHNGRLFSRQSGSADSWSRLDKTDYSGKIPLSVAAFSLAPTADGLLFVAGKDGQLLRSSDGGIHWVELQTPTSAKPLVAVEVNQSDPRVVIAGGAQGVLRTTDGGFDWELVGVPGGVVGLSRDLGSPNRHFALDTGGAPWVSTDDGKSWQSAGSSLPQITVKGVGRTAAVKPIPIRTLFPTPVPVKGVMAIAVDGRLLHTADGGQNWSPVPGGALVGGDITAATVGSTDLFVATRSGEIFRLRPGHEFEVFRRLPPSNAGRTITGLFWSDPDNGLFASTSHIGADAGSNDLRVHFVRGEKWFALNYCVTPHSSFHAVWSKETTAGALVFAAVRNYRQMDAYASDSRGAVPPLEICYSSDLGESWNPVFVTPRRMVMLGDPLARVFTPDRRSSEVWLQYGYTYSSMDGGLHWTEVRSTFEDIAFDAEDSSLRYVTTLSNELYRLKILASPETGTYTAIGKGKRVLLDAKDSKRVLSVPGSGISADGGFTWASVDSSLGRDVRVDYSSKVVPVCFAGGRIVLAVVNNMILLGYTLQVVETADSGVSWLRRYLIKDSKTKPTVETDISDQRRLLVSERLRKGQLKVQQSLDCGGTFAEVGGLPERATEQIDPEGQRVGMDFEENPPVMTEGRTSDGHGYRALGADGFGFLVSLDEGTWLRKGGIPDQGSAPEPVQSGRKSLEASVPQIVGGDAPTAMKPETRDLVSQGPAGSYHRQKKLGDFLHLSEDGTMVLRQDAKMYKGTWRSLGQNQLEIVVGTGLLKSKSRATLAGGILKDNGGELWTLSK